MVRNVSCEFQILFQNFYQNAIPEMKVIVFANYPLTGDHLPAGAWWMHGLSFWTPSKQRRFLDEIGMKSFDNCANDQ